MGMELLIPILSSAAGAAVSGMFSGGGSSPAAPVPAPAVEPPTLMPDPLAQKQAMKRKTSILQGQQMGRASTVLTGGDKLGG